jgi:hypothetical protein
MVLVSHRARARVLVLGNYPTAVDLCRPVGRHVQAVLDLLKEDRAVRERMFHEARYVGDGDIDPRTNVHRAQFCAGRLGVGGTIGVPADVVDVTELDALALSRDDARRIKRD